MAPNQSTRRLTWLLWGLLLWSGAIFGRLVWLQVFDHETLLAYAESQQQDTKEVPALRGTIYDRTGQPLAKSVEASMVVVNPQVIPDLRQAAYVLATTLNLNNRELLARLERSKADGKRYLRVARKLSLTETERVKALKQKWIQFEPETRRFYPNGTLAAHVLGSVGFTDTSDIERGNGGIEQKFEKELSGTPGQARVYRDSRQDVYDSELLRDPDPGTDLTLSIDPQVQYQAERQIEEAVKASGARSGSVVAIDPYTGEIYAMANYPTFDPNMPPSASDPKDARNNITVTSPFEPGSVFKIFTMAAALETTSFTPASMVDAGNGAMNLFGRVIHDEKRYGMLSMADVFAKSSNIGTIKVALNIGNETLHRYQQVFGFGTRTGIALPGESSGVVWPVNRWTKSSIGSMAIGHEVSVTSLQLALAGASVANGGNLVKPRLVISRKQPGLETERIKVESPQRILRPETAVTLRQMMEGVVLHGTGKRAVIPGYTSGGKTGSAQVYDADLRAYTHTYNASFLGFAPVTNPRIVVAVTLHRTTGGTQGYGGVRAAPVFREVAASALRMLNVPPDLPGALPAVAEADVEGDLSIAGLNTDLAGVSDLDLAGSAQRAVSSVTPPLVRGENTASAGDSSSDQRHFLNSGASTASAGPRVPDFRGKSVREVLRESSAKGLQVEVLGSGLAMNQSPQPGAALRPHETVRVQFGQ